MKDKVVREASKRFEDAWRKALADRGKQQRNRRDRRPRPPIVGVRIPPPPEDAA